MRSRRWFTSLMGGLDVLSFLSARRRNLKQEQGMMMVEASVLLPFLVILLIFILDYGRAMHQYMSLVTVAREAVNQGSRIHGLGNGSCSTDGSIAASTCGALTAPQLHMHHRARGLLNVVGGNLDQTPGQLTLTSRYSTSQDLVTFEIEGKYPTLFGLLGDSIPLRVYVSAPHLASLGS